MSNNYNTRHGWTEAGIRDMAYEKDTFEKDEKGEPVIQDFDYEFISWQTSEYVHASILSLFGHATKQGIPFRIRANIEEETMRGDEALFNVLVFISKTFVSALRGLKTDQPAILVETKRLLSSYAESFSEKRATIS
jgi:hypothetical protein